MWNFYRFLIWDALHFAEGMFSRWQYILGIIVAFAAVYGLDLAGLSIWWSLLLLGPLVLLRLLWVNYKRYDALREKIRMLEDRLSPRFEVVFDEGAPFEQRDVWANSNEVQWRWFRIGVKNTGMETIDDVVVRLEELYDLSSDPPAKSPVPPIVLRQMNDNPINGQYRQSFMLHHESTQFVEVVRKSEADITAETDEIMLGYAESRPELIPCRRHALLISVTGRNAPKVVKWFFADVDANGQLLFGQEAYALDATLTRSWARRVR